MSTFLWLAVALAISAWCAVRARRLLIAAIWLAVVSILTAWLFYELGAPIVAVIELSVGAGLVMVLLVFAFSLAGDEAMDRAALTPPLLAAFLVVTAVGLAVWVAGPPRPEVLPAATAGAQGVTAAEGAAPTLWELRPLDLLLQIVLILAGALGVMGLLQPDPIVEKGPVESTLISQAADAPASPAAPRPGEVVP